MNLTTAIESFYRKHDIEVSSHFLSRVSQFRQQKKRLFSWLFGDRDRIVLRVPFTDITQYHTDHNTRFNELLRATQDFLFDTDESYLLDDLKTAILRNRIQFRKNSYRFSKFYRRYVDKQSTVNFQQFYNDLKTGECVLSIHPMDFITASENASFSSCLQVTSCHHTTTTGYLRDPYSIVAKVVRNGSKLGRQFIFFDDGAIIFGRTYGVIADVLQERIRRFLEERYARHLRLKDEWEYDRGRFLGADQVDGCGHYKNDHDKYSVYFDLDTTGVSRHKTCTRGFDDVQLVFPPGIDHLGHDTRSGNFGTTHCTLCGTVIEDEDDIRETDTGPVCYACRDEYFFQCSLCDRVLHETRMGEYIEDKDVYLCRACTKHQQSEESMAEAA